MCVRVHAYNAFKFLLFSAPFTTPPAVVLPIPTWLLLYMLFDVHYKFHETNNYISA